MNVNQAHLASPSTYKVIALNQHEVAIMAMNRIQFQPGLSMPEFLKAYGTELQCEQAQETVRWPDGFRCPRCEGAGHFVFRDGPRKVFQCTGCRHQASLIADRLSGHEIAVDHVVSGDLSDQPGQDRAVGLGAEATVGRELPYGVADPSQTDAGDG